MSTTITTDRLRLDAPRRSDIAQLHRILSDPLVWQHFPSRRHTDLTQTETAVEEWMQDWARDGLGYWVVRLNDAPGVVGYGGCSVRDDALWNLAYRLAPAVQGHGYAAEMSIHAIQAAHELRPALPVVAYLLRHNTASAAIATRVGLQLVASGPDVGNPDPSAVRDVYADRVLSEEVVCTAMR